MEHFLNFQMRKERDKDRMNFVEAKRNNFLDILSHSILFPIWFLGNVVLLHMLMSIVT